MKLKKRTPTDKKRESITIAQSLCDQNLLGAALGDPTTWSRWLSVLRAAFALPMTEQDKVACALAPSEAPHGDETGCFAELTALIAAFGR